MIDMKKIQKLIVTYKGILNLLIRIRNYYGRKYYLWQLHIILQKGLFHDLEKSCHFNSIWGRKT